MNPGNLFPRSAIAMMELPQLQKFLDEWLPSADLSSDTDEDNTKFARFYVNFLGCEINCHITKKFAKEAAGETQDIIAWALGTAATVGSSTSTPELKRITKLLVKSRPYKVSVWGTTFANPVETSMQCAHTAGVPTQGPTLDSYVKQHLPSASQQWFQNVAVKAKVAMVLNYMTHLATNGCNYFDTNAPGQDELEAIVALYNLSAPSDDTCFLLAVDYARHTAGIHLPATPNRVLVNIHEDFNLDDCSMHLGFADIYSDRRQSRLARTWDGPD